MYTWAGAFVKSGFATSRLDCSMSALIAGISIVAFSVSNAVAASCDGRTEGVVVVCPFVMVGVGSGCFDDASTTFEESGSSYS